MNFFERHTKKILITLILIMMLIILMFPRFFIYLSELPTFSLYVIFLFPVAFFFIYKLYANKKRVIALEEYAEKYNYDFYEKPDEAQTSLFKEFSSTKIINNEDKFFNLLVPKDDNDTKPLIVTGKSEIGGGESSHTYYTQIFLYKHNTDLPKFYIQRKTKLDIIFGKIKERTSSNETGIKLYKFKKKKFPHNKYFFFSEDPNIENFITNEFIELLKIGIIKKKALINIESNGKNLIFYKQWSRHSLELMDYYSNLFKVIKESLIK